MIRDLIADWHLFWSQVDFVHVNWLDWSGQTWTVLFVGALAALWSSAH